NFADGLFGFLAIDKVENATGSPPLDGALLEARVTRAVWFRPLQDINVPVSETNVNVGVFTAEKAVSPPAAPFTDSWFGNPQKAVMRRVTQPFDGTVSLDLLECAAAGMPLPGSVVRVNRGNPNWWMAVDSATSKPDGTPVIVGRPFQIVNAPISLPRLNSVERLTFEIWVRKDEEYATSISDLGLE